MSPCWLQHFILEQSQEGSTLVDALCGSSGDREKADVYINLEIRETGQAET